MSIRISASYSLLQVESVFVWSSELHIELPVKEFYVILYPQLLKELNYSFVVSVVAISFLKSWEWNFLPICVTLTLVFFQILLFNSVYLIPNLL